MSTVVSAEMIIDICAMARSFACEVCARFCLCLLMQTVVVGEVVVEPLRKLVLLLSGPNKVIEKRFDKLIDYNNLLGRDKDDNVGVLFVHSVCSPSMCVHIVVPLICVFMWILCSWHLPIVCVFVCYACNTCVLCLLCMCTL